MKKFTMTVTVENGKFYNHTENQGFNALELLGALETKKNDILKQMISPTEFERVLVEDGKEYVITE